MVRLLTSRMALVLCAMFAMGCWAEQTPTRTARAEAKPTGRTADLLECPARRPPVRNSAGCEPRILGEQGDGVSLSSSPNGPTPPPLGLPGRTEMKRCTRESLVLCGFFVEGPPGSYALSCRDGEGNVTGSARFVAPDGSVLAEGSCDRGRALGAWLWWSGHRLVRAVATVDNVSLGLELDWKDGEYHAVSHSPPAQAARSR